MKQKPKPHDPECECDEDYLCATDPGSWCECCGHARSQHYITGVCSCASCRCYGYVGANVQADERNTAKGS